MKKIICLACLICFICSMILYRNITQTQYDKIMIYLNDEKIYESTVNEIHETLIKKLTESPKAYSLAKDLLVEWEYTIRLRKKDSGAITYGFIYTFIVASEHQIYDEDKDIFRKAKVADEMRKYLANYNESIETKLTN